jgi:hypothetical protein
MLPTSVTGSVLEYFLAWYDFCSEFEFGKLNLDGTIRTVGDIDA